VPVQIGGMREEKQVWWDRWSRKGTRKKKKGCHNSKPEPSGLSFTGRRSSEDLRLELVGDQGIIQGEKAKRICPPNQKKIVTRGKGR